MTSTGTFNVPMAAQAAETVALVEWEESNMEGKDGTMAGGLEWGPLLVAAMPTLEGARLVRLSVSSNQIARSAWLWHATGLKPWGFRQRKFPNDEARCGTSLWKYGHSVQFRNLGCRTNIRGKLIRLTLFRPPVGTTLPQKNGLLSASPARFSAVRHVESGRF